MDVEGVVVPLELLVVVVPDDAPDDEDEDDEDDELLELALGAAKDEVPLESSSDKPQQVATPTDKALRKIT